MSTKDPRHYDVIIAPVITEEATNASEQSKVVFKVTLAATKPQIKEAVEKLFDVKVKSVQHAAAARQVEGVPRRPRAAGGHQARHRDPGRGSAHRRDHGTCRERGAMALKSYNPVTPGQRQLVPRRPLRPAYRCAGKGADRGAEFERRPQQRRAHHRALTAAAATSRPTARSTSSAAGSMRRPRSSASNTIRTAPASSH